MQTPSPSSSPSVCAEPFSLLDKYQRGWVKFQGGEPRNLEELSIAYADIEHKRRLAEVKAMRPKLALLDAFLPKLAEHGLRVWSRDIHTYDRGKTLRIYTGTMELNNDKLHAALLALGFKETDRKTNSRDDTITLKHGRSLLISIDVSKQVPLAASPQAATEKAAA